MIGFGNEGEPEEAKRFKLDVLRQRTVAFGLTAVVVDLREGPHYVGGFLDFWTWTVKLGIRIRK